MAKKPVWLGLHWLMLGVTAVLLVLVATFVDLKPVVDENFFFSTSDPGYRQSKKIEQHFPSQPEIIVAVSSNDISSPRYLGRIQRLTQQALHRESRIVFVLRSPMSDPPKDGFAVANLRPLTSDVRHSLFTIHLSPITLGARVSLSREAACALQRGL